MKKADKRIKITHLFILEHPENKYIRSVDKSQRGVHIKRQGQGLDEPPQIVRTAQKRDHRQEELSFRRSGAAQAAPLQSLTGYAHDCKKR